MSTTIQAASPPARGQHWVIAGLLVLIVFHLASNIWWLQHDNLPQVGDPGEHLLGGKRYYNALTDPAKESLLSRIVSLRHVPNGIYPPLTHISGAITALIFGDNKFGYTLSVTGYFLVLIAAMYTVARSVFTPPMALYATFLVSFTPFLYGSSRLFLTDLPAVCFVTLVFAILLRTDFMKHRRWALALGMAAGLSFWTRWTSPLYFAIPVVFLAVATLLASRSRNRDAESESPAAKRAIWINVFIAVILAIVIASLWAFLPKPDLKDVYVNHFAKMQYPLNPSNAAHWLTYPIIVINVGTFLPLGLCAFAGFAVATWDWRAKRNTALGVLVLWVAGSIIALMFMWIVRNPAPRYVLPLLPPLGILAAYAFYKIPNTTLRHGLMTALAVTLILQYTHLSYGALPVAMQIEVPVTDRFQWHGRNVRNNMGLVIFAEDVDASGAKYGPPYRGENWIERIMGRIVGIDKEGHYIHFRQANVLLAGVHREAVELTKRDYWPLIAPLQSPVRGDAVVSPFVPLSTLDLNLQIAAGNSPPSGPDAGMRQFQQTARLYLTWNSDQWTGAISASLASPAPFQRYTVGYLPDPDSGQPVILGTWNNPSRFLFATFPPVQTDRLFIDFEQPATGGGHVAVNDHEVYAVFKQPRPINLTGHFASVKDIQPDDLFAKDYLIIALPNLNQSPPEFENFTIVDDFEDAIFGYWGQRRFVLYARDTPRVFTFQSHPQLNVQVSGDFFPNGRWDMPWWSFSETTAVRNTGIPDCWASEVPTTASVHFRQPVSVEGLEIVPYSDEFGVGSAQVEYWNLERGEWNILDESLYRIDLPKYRTGDDRWIPKTYPPKWNVPLRTDRFRITLLEGTPVTDSSSVAVVANILIYGTPQHGPANRPNDQAEP